MKITKKGVFALATAGLLAASLAACSSTSSDTSSSSSASSTPSAEASPVPLASIPSLTGVDTEVTVDQGFVDALTSLGLTPGVVGTATFTDGVFAFPITGGNVDYYDPNESYRPYVQGVINHEGSGISLTAGDTVVELTNFTIDPGSNSHLSGDVTVNGEVAATQANLFTLDGTTLKPLQTGDNDTAILEGTRVIISPEAADLLNSTFGTTAVTSDLLVGIAKITVNTK